MTDETPKRKRGGQPGVSPPKTGAERVKAHRERLRDEGKPELRGIFIGEVARGRLVRLAELWGITHSETIGRALRIAEENEEAASE